MEEGNYALFWQEKQVGTVRVSHQGLYCRFRCRCGQIGGAFFRLAASCGGRSIDLGLLVPMEDGFGTDCSMPLKRLPEGLPSFRLLPHDEREEPPGDDRDFVELDPEQPFERLSEITDAVFTGREGKPGILLPRRE